MMRVFSFSTSATILLAFQNIFFDACLKKEDLRNVIIYSNINYIIDVHTGIYIPRKRDEYHKYKISKHQNIK